MGTTRIVKLNTGHICLVLNERHTPQTHDFCVMHSPQGKPLRVTDMKQSETIRWVPRTAVVWLLDME